MREAHRPSAAVPLVEVLDRVIDRGAVVTGDAVIGLADVDLVEVALRLVVVPAGRRASPAGRPASPAQDRAVAAPPEGGSGGRVGSRPVGRSRCTPMPAAPGPAPSVSGGAARSGAAPARLEQGLAQLVLTVVELLRELLDRQAARRAMRGLLSDEQAERLGVALVELDARMDELVAAFGLDREDLNLNLGPLGELL